MIELTTPQFLTLAGLSAVQVTALIRITVQLARLIVGQAALKATSDEHGIRLQNLERKPA
jgi:hypothetical protein